MVRTRYLFPLVAAAAALGCSEEAPEPIDGTAGTGATVAGTGATVAGTGSTVAGTGSTVAGNGSTEAGSGSTAGTGSTTAGMPAMPEPSAPAAGPSYAETVEPLLQNRCVSGCHSPGSFGGSGGSSAESGLDLDTGTGYDALVDVPSMQLDTMMLVGDTLDTSYLWHKLNNTHTTVGGSGLAMPFGIGSDAPINAAVQAWIEGGSQP